MQIITLWIEKMYYKWYLRDFHIMGAPCGSVFTSRYPSTLNLNVFNCVCLVEL